MLLLQRVRTRVRKVAGYAADDPSVRDDRWLDGMKYAHQTAIEACIDVAQHVVASEALGTPATNADAFRAMATGGLLSSELAEQLADAVGFRNVLVHGYADVDDDLAVAHLGRVDVLDEFVAVVADVIEQD